MPVTHELRRFKDRLKTPVVMGRRDKPGHDVKWIEAPLSAPQMLACVSQSAK